VSPSAAGVGVVVDLDDRLPAERLERIAEAVSSSVWPAKEVEEAEVVSIGG